jgi:hypothetical protein
MKACEGPGARDVPAPAFYRPGGEEEAAAWDGFEFDFVLSLMDDGTAPAWEVSQGRWGRGLHSSTFWLNVSAFCGIGGAKGIA